MFAYNIYVCLQSLCLSTISIIVFYFYVCLLSLCLYTISMFVYNIYVCLQYLCLSTISMIVFYFYVCLLYLWLYSISMFCLLYLWLYSISMFVYFTFVYHIYVSSQSPGIFGSVLGVGPPAKNRTRKRFFISNGQKPYLPYPTHRPYQLLVLKLNILMNSSLTKSIDGGR